MDRFAVAAVLREIGALLELQGGNPFKARAYERGARALEAFAGDLDALVAERRLTSLPGIGTALAGTIAELHETGRSEQLERLRGQLPPGILELSQVPHLTLPRIRALHEALGISTVADLKTAAEAGRVRGVKGFGPKTEEKLLEGIREFETRGEAVLLYQADREGQALLDYVRAPPGVRQADLAGALRRRDGGRGPPGGDRGHGRPGGAPCWPSPAIRRRWPWSSRTSPARARGWPAA